MAILQRLAPGGRRFTIRTPLAEDECRWFNRAVEENLFRFGDCSATCFRRVKWGVSGPDHFETSTGAPRHLFSSPHVDHPALNREYIPHIAAYARAIYALGYDPARSSFSRYRKYGRDLLTKRSGGSYETDAEFYDAAGRIHLHIEAKKDARQVTILSAQLDKAVELADLPPGTAKEVETSWTCLLATCGS